MRNSFGTGTGVAYATGPRAATSDNGRSIQRGAPVRQPPASTSKGSWRERPGRRRWASLTGAAALAITTATLLSQPASAQSPTDLLSQLEAEVGTAVAAANVGGTDPPTYYMEIAKDAKQLLTYIKAGQSPCRTSLGAAHRLLAELANKTKLKADILLAESGLLNCGVLIRTGATPVTGTTTPTEEPPSVIVEGFSETVKTKTKSGKFGGTEVDHRALVGEPRAGDAASCSNDECYVQVTADTKKTSDINAANSIDPKSPCSYSHLFSSSVSNDGVAALVVHYSDTGRVTTAQLKYAPTIAIGIPPTEAGGTFLWSCIFLRADDTAVENNFDDKSVNATILGDGNAVSVDLSHSGSVAGKGFSGDGHTNLKGPLSGTLNYTVTTRITFRLTH
jgi:hypothetical protein